MSFMIRVSSAPVALTQRRVSHGLDDEPAPLIARPLDVSGSVGRQHHSSPRAATPAHRDQPRLLAPGPQTTQNRSARMITRVIGGCSLVATLIVAGDARHNLLQGCIGKLARLGDKLLGGLAPQDGSQAPPVKDRDLAG